MIVTLPRRTVEIAFESLDRPLGLEGRVLPGRESPVELGFWIRSVGLGNMFDICRHVAMVVRPRRSGISDGLTPTSASCAARVLARVAVPIGW